MSRPSLPTRRLRRALASASALAFAVACTEPHKAVQVEAAPAPILEARIELSDSVALPGSEVRATVRLTGSPVASITARLAWDSTGLEFVGEEAIEDGATRVLNPAPGLLRFAAIAPQGFTGGRLYAVRFAVRRTAALRSLRLDVDELHTVTHADARAALAPRRP